MEQILQKYGGPAFHKKILNLLYEEVTNKREVKHYFFNITLDNVIHDQLLYMSYVMQKPERYYREPFLQITKQSIRINGGMFEDIQKMFKGILKKLKVHQDDINRINWHVFQVLEETRDQTEDTTSMVLKPIEISIKGLAELLNDRGLSTKVLENNDIYIFSGATYPIWLRVNEVDNKITLIGQAFPIGTPAQELVQQVAEAANEKKFSTLNFVCMMAGASPILLTRYSINYANGLPIRLLVRLIHHFSNDFATALDQDKEGYLKNVKK